MSSTLPRILGAGYTVPAGIRTNNDPVFDWLIHHPPPHDPFQGYVERRVLDERETLMDIMVPAARNALDAAGLSAGKVDLLLGCGSVSTYWNPNDLTLLHQRLGLPRSTQVVALNNEFSNFAASLYFADGLLRAGRIGNALIVAGGNWTRHVDYKTPQAASAADGAGAAVMGMSADPTQFAVIDTQTITESQYFGSMFMLGSQEVCDGRPVWTNPVFQITPEGMAGFSAFGAQTAPRAVIQLLQRHGIAPAWIGLIAHQASQTLYDAWTQAIGVQARQLLQTIRQFANMTVANNAVNLAYASVQGPIPYQYLVMLSLGPDMHANALLLARDQ
jgi:3-oxoacyl-[acyl-carrier-protein] synthase III